DHYNKTPYHNLLDHYAKKVSALGAQDTPQSQNAQVVYMQALEKLYNHRVEEAVALFRQVLAIRPGHLAAKIRLREAEGMMQHAYN
ncbi:MAG: hypothetical protein ABIH41_01415, partial [Nanoarchaeota archaeon]